MVNVLLAHMGGIDEIGIFVVPALLAIFALRWAEKRARQRAAAEDEVLSPLSARRGEGTIAEGDGEDGN